MDVLKKCPVCEHEAQYWNTPHVGGLHDYAVLDAFGFAVECSYCGLTTRGYFTKKQAAEAWNQRGSTTWDAGAASLIIDMWNAHKWESMESIWDGWFKERMKILGFEFDE